MFGKSVSKRRGITIFQLLTGLLAASIGFYAGATFVGLNINRVAYYAMDQTELIDQVPEDWRPEMLQQQASLVEAERETRLAELQARLTDLELMIESNGFEKTEIASLQVSIEQGRENAQSLKADYPATLTHWSDLVTLYKKISDLDNRASTTENSQAKWLTVRKNLYQYASEYLMALETNGVDPKILEMNVRLSEWFTAGLQQAEDEVRFEHLLATGDPPINESQSIQQSRIQLKKFSELLHRRMVETQQYLQTHYDLN